MIRKTLAGTHDIPHEAGNVSFALLYSKRKTLTIRIRPDCTVMVDAPTGTPLGVAEEPLIREYAALRSLSARLALPSTM